jgi:hypothetical protein
MKRLIQWSFDTTVNNVHCGDDVYILEEAEEPMIVGQNGLLFYLAVLAVAPPVYIYRYLK